MANTMCITNGGRRRVTFSIDCNGDFHSLRTHSLSFQSGCFSIGLVDSKSPQPNRNPIFSLVQRLGALRTAALTASASTRCILRTANRAFSFSKKRRVVSTKRHYLFDCLSSFGCSRL
ncbi:hypothetical protein PIB30_078997 [Stylosanthes scabra]|uniref:Uncharacterized protein n=1 Tax=Stylosanthes scabra TaxID=79078 RepID=A0ABU6US85_9FABA|nr:hypothetical protein [Stylosanthes scabra]